MRFILNYIVIFQLLVINVIDMNNSELYTVTKEIFHHKKMLETTKFLNNNNYNIVYDNMNNMIILSFNMIKQNYELYKLNITVTPEKLQFINSNYFLVKYVIEEDNYKNLILYIQMINRKTNKMFLTKIYNYINIQLETIYKNGIYIIDLLEGDIAIKINNKIILSIPIINKYDKEILKNWYKIQTKEKPKIEYNLDFIFDYYLN